MTATMVHRDTDLRPTARRRPIIATAAGIGIVALLGGMLLGWFAADRSLQPNAPAEGSVEVGFARDMTVHHAQAVEMAELIRDRTENPELRQLAVDIALTQQAQIGQMRGWLDVWNVPPTSTQPPMAWMDHPAEGQMPGMATSAQINHLRRLRGDAADGLFLRLMIEHHRAGVAMAEAALERSDEPVVLRLADAIAAAQANEVEVLRRMLGQRTAGTPRADQGRSNDGEGH